MSKNKLLFITLNLFLLFGCLEAGAPSNSQTKLVIPLISECEQYVIAYLDNIPEKIEISYSIIRSDYEMRAIPSLSGYIEIRGARHSKEQLMATVNTFILDCYPESRTTLNKDQEMGSSLANALDINRRMGIGKNYIVDDDDKIHIYVNRIKGGTHKSFPVK